MGTLGSRVSPPETFVQEPKNHRGIFVKGPSPGAWIKSRRVVPVWGRIVTQFCGHLIFLKKWGYGGRNPVAGGKAPRSESTHSWYFFVECSGRFHGSRGFAVAKRMGQNLFIVNKIFLSSPLGSRPARVGPHNPALPTDEVRSPGPWQAWIFHPCQRWFRSDRLVHVRERI